MMTSNQGMFYTMNILTEYKKAISNPNTSISKIAAIIEKDPGLTCTALKIANSSFYGFSKSVRTVKQAISILGYKTLERILLTQAVKTTLVPKNQPFLMDLWKHSLASAIAAQLIIHKCEPLLSEQAFIAALLHDLGKFMLINFKKEYTENLMTIIEKNPHQCTICIEHENFGIDHQEIGEFFAKKWLFPENVSNTIRYHHSLDICTADKEMTYAVAIANNIAKAMEFGRSTSGLIELLPHYVYTTIGFKTSDFEDIVHQTKDKFYELTSFMEE